MDCQITPNLYSALDWLTCYNYTSEKVNKMTDFISNGKLKINGFR